jgi:prevent-host-death family protein
MKSSEEHSIKIICKNSFVVVPWAVPHGVQDEEGTMPRVIPTEDVRPLSEFRANTAAFMNQVRETRRPVILTQHGRSAAVLLDVRAYEDLVERAEILNDVQIAQAQIAEGKGIADSDFKKIVLERLGL